MKKQSGNDSTLLRKLDLKRIVLYLIGMVVLALGLTLNTKTSLGASAIVSVPYTLSEAYGLNLGNMTLAIYAVFILVQIVLDRKHFVLILLQLPLSLVFTRFMNLFKAWIPYSSTIFALNVVVAVGAIALTATGAFLTIHMDLIPNPGDGFVSILSKVTGLELGRCKNLIDITCVCISAVIGLLNGKILMGIGVGTILSMVLVGLFLSWINKAFREKLLSYVQK